jgi:hypothetical protein
MSVFHRDVGTCLAPKRSRHGTRRTCLLAAMLVAGTVLAGCAQDPVPEILRQLHDSRDQLAKCNQQSLEMQAQLHQQEQQIATLQQLGDKRLDKLFRVSKIQVGDRSMGIADGNTTGDIGVKVYVETLDQYGDTIKAAGDVTVQLYDLAEPPNSNFIGEFAWLVDKMQVNWTEGFMSQFYIFECKWKSPPRHDQITVRIAFTDYLTGKTFTDQKAVQVTLPGPASKPAIK